MWQTGDCQRARLGNRDCPWVVCGERQFYSADHLVNLVFHACIKGESMRSELTPCNRYINI